MKVILLLLCTTILFGLSVTFTLPKICTAELIHKKNGKVVYVEKVDCKTVQTKEGIVYQTAPRKEKGK